ncbi:hypothetical protein CC2G_009150 [Coprinopsis cinerea AmutBmut pab1-1]|nr:hypothetical protein CC2G_009150 [Coprinopsis cinerea AmutBmut pab1-1]
MSQSTKKAKDIKALPLSETLRDLALLRASEVDLAGLLPGEAAHEAGNDKGDEAVKTSSEFIAETRKALKVQDRGELETQGQKLEEVRLQYEELSAGLNQNAEK